MSSAPLDRNQYSKNDNRRVHVRRRIDQLAYAKFGPDNGGILINLSEGGLSFQGVGVVGKDELLPVTFTLPGMPPQIEATGQVVWSNDSGKGGGLRFIDMTEETRKRIKDWIVGNAVEGQSFPREVTAQPGPALNVAPSEKKFVQSFPPLTAKEPLGPPASPRPQPRPIKWQTSSSATFPAAIPKVAGMPAPKAPRVVSEFYEPPKAPNAPKPQFVTFAAGVLAGCAVVLAAIAGARMLGNAGRPASVEEVKPIVGQRATISGDQNPPVTKTGIIPSNSQLTLNNKPAATIPSIPSADRGSIAKAPSRESRVPERPGESVIQEEIPSKNAVTDLALLAPHLPNSSTVAEVRQPANGEGLPPRVASLDDARAVTPSMPAPRRPAQPLPEKVDRTAGFLEPVLIEQSAPIYPPGAKANHIQGVVKLSATIGTDGVPRQLKLMSGDLILAQAVKDAVSHWHYVPAVFRGAPVESNIVIVINFKLK